MLQPDWDRKWSNKSRNLQLNVVKWPPIEYSVYIVYTTALNKSLSYNISEVKSLEHGLLYLCKHGRRDTQEYHGLGQGHQPEDLTHAAASTLTYSSLSCCMTVFWSSSDYTLFLISPPCVCGNTEKNKINSLQTDHPPVRWIL